MTTTAATTTNSFLDSLRGATTTGTGSTVATKGNPTIDTSGFLKLLTAQMTNQDPTSPMDSSTMVQQLSTMTQTSSLTEMDTTMKALLAEATGNRVGDAASWIGKAALVASPTAQPLADGSFQGEITLPSAASALSLSLQDASGNTVYAKEFGGEKAGAVDFSFDGKDAAGGALAGPLKVVVSATGASGTTVTPTVSTWTTVTGVNSPAGGSATSLTTSLGTVAPADVLSLS